MSKHREIWGYRVRYTSVRREITWASESMSSSSFKKRPMAVGHISGSKVFSYRIEASVRRPSRVEDFRTLTASKLALSSSRLSVSSAISESRPPIMPAMATGSPLQQIIKVFSSTWRS